MKQRDWVEELDQKQKWKWETNIPFNIIFDRIDPKAGEVWYKIYYDQPDNSNGYMWINASTA